MIVTLLISLLAFSGTARAECTSGPVTAGQFVSHAERAVAAFEDLDDDGFNAALTDATASIPCITSALTPEQAASFHRARALQTFLVGDEPGTTKNFRAALRAEPTFVLPVSLAPAGGPLAALYQRAASEGTDATKPLPNLTGTAIVDGRDSKQLPTTTPAIVQITAPGGSVLWADVIVGVDEIPSSMLTTSAPAPGPVPVLKPEPSDNLSTVAPIDRAPRERSGARKPLLISAIASGVAAAALYGTSAAVRSSYDNNPRASTRQTVNALYFSALGVGVVGASLGGSAFLVNDAPMPALRGVR